MGNCRANLHTGLEVLDLTNREVVKKFFEDFLEQDQDLHANGDEYWTCPEGLSDDDEWIPRCEQLGYETELDMIVGEAMKNRSVKNPKCFSRVFDIVFQAINGQDFFGDCEWHYEVISKDKIVVSWTTGGYNQW